MDKVNDKQSLNKHSDEPRSKESGHRHADMRGKKTNTGKCKDKPVRGLG